MFKPEQLVRFQIYSSATTIMAVGRVLDFRYNSVHYGRKFVPGCGISLLIQLLEPSEDRFNPFWIDTHHTCVWPV
jgi:hypothetical protein